MAKKKAHTHWKVLPHGALEKLDERLWHIAGEVPGMPIGRHMCVARLGDGRLLIHNAIPLEDELMAGGAEPALGEDHLLELARWRVGIVAVQHALAIEVEA